MDLINLLDFVSGLDEREKEQVLTEEYNRQRAIINSLCETKRVREEDNNATSRI